MNAIIPTKLTKAQRLAAEEYANSLVEELLQKKLWYIGDIRDKCWIIAMSDRRYKEHSIQSLYDEVHKLFREFSQDMTADIGYSIGKINQALADRNICVDYKEEESNA